MKEMDKLARGRGCRAKNGGRDVNELNGLGIGLNSQTLLIIKLPDSRSLRIISRSLFLAMMLLTLPSLGSIMRASSNASLFESHSEMIDGINILPVILRDLLDEGLIKKGDKGFVLSNTVGDDPEFLRDAGIDLLTGADLRWNKVGARQMFDFVYAPSFRGAYMIDGVLEDDGLVISPLGVDLTEELKMLRNFKIVYLRRFDKTVVAMRKMASLNDGLANSAAKQVFCGISAEKKKAALKGLEDVYLEPPRQAALAKKSSFTSRKIKFLPDLLKDSLDEYPRRVFITDDSNALDWFYKNYPMRDQEFEVYNMEVVIDNDGLSRGGKAQESESDWITKIVRPEDYVVMKAEAEVVEQMMREKTLCLVDELFLECRNQWEDREEENGSKRAYWQCLALYGKVRDEGIAVHQWWY